MLRHTSDTTLTIKRKQESIMGQFLCASVTYCLLSLSVSKNTCQQVLVNFTNVCQHATRSLCPEVSRVHFNCYPWPKYFNNFIHILLTKPSTFSLKYYFNMTASGQKEKIFAERLFSVHIVYTVHSTENNKLKGIILYFFAIVHNGLHSTNHFVLFCPKKNNYT